MAGDSLVVSHTHTDSTGFRSVLSSGWETFELPDNIKMSSTKRMSRGAIVRIFSKDTAEMPRTEEAVFLAEE